MATRYYDRYQNFRNNGSMNVIPGLSLNVYTTDISVIYKLGQTRLDILSNTYYNSPYYGWLIMLANQQYGGLEFLIPDQSIIVIPYPLESAIDRYITSVNNYNSLYGG
jgi:hypothetical protein